MNINISETRVPVNRHTDVTPCSSIGLSLSISDRNSPTALKMTTLYKHIQIVLESFRASMCT
ncbi:hypothetical protein DPMN_065168 [Dreissena polymorpha]|uniref:Uncharacterized protein n=1 Tax=Dreissena polymorpha TaxID=45954 RepID=A0A9D4CEI5_DREPO|nr:hypothetical protein DPMN_065168 [Dreissena polymorpha]